MTEDWQKPQQTIEERIARIENKIKAIEMQIATPLVGLATAGQTIGQSILRKFEVINETLADHAVSIGEHESRISDKRYAAIDTAINTDELRAGIEPFAAGQLIPASSLRDTSKHWRDVITMLRSKNTEPIGRSHLKTAGVGVSRRGKFIYFIKGAENGK